MIQEEIEAAILEDAIQDYIGLWEIDWIMHSLSPKASEQSKRNSPTVSASTVYIGGVYETKSDGTVTKYYGALGRTLAIRQAPAGGGAGTLSFVLQDHLGSTVGLTDTNGVAVPNSKTTYWPYGATRSTTAASTDKLYTGQQVESGDAGLGWATTRRGSTRRCWDGS